jgi:hypothetical protein
MTLCFLRVRARRGSALLALSMIAAVAISLSCGGGPAAVPNPTPTPTKPPAATPTTPPVAVCPYGNGSMDATCEQGHQSQFQDQVQAAIDSAIQQHPELFDKSRSNPDGSQQYKILDLDGYMNALVATLSLQGFCAEREVYEPGTNRIHVKNSSQFSEDFAVYTSAGYIRRDRCYVQTCNPSSFPVELPDNVPPPESGCGKPFPPPLSDFAVKVNTHGVEYSILDSTPRVTNCAYCKEAGFVDGRCTCPLRPPEASDREACENWAVGIANDTGKPGPTWKHINEDGSKNFCTGPESGCEHDPAGPYDLRVYNNGPGLYRVCADSGVCGEVIADR